MPKPARPAARRPRRDIQARSNGAASRERADGRGGAGVNSFKHRLLQLPADLASGERRRVHVDVVGARTRRDRLEQRRVDGRAGVDRPVGAGTDGERDDDRTRDVARCQVDVRGDGGRGEITRGQGVAEFVAADFVGGGVLELRADGPPRVLALESAIDKREHDRPAAPAPSRASFRSALRPGRPVRRTASFGTRTPASTIEATIRSYAGKRGPRRSGEQQPSVRQRSLWLRLCASQASSDQAADP